MLRSLLLAAMLLLASVTALAAPASAKPMRVLFVGNSLSYVHNLPATFAALAKAEGKPVEVRMLVRGGHTLSQHLDSGVLTPALLGTVDRLVLQERGGDLICSDSIPMMIDNCRNSRAAHARLVALARSSGAAPVLLGTYQPLEGASQRVEEIEAEVAKELGIERVPVSEDLRIGALERPAAHWLEPDGHPGEEATLLMAIKLYRTLFGGLPQAHELDIEGEDYSAAAKFSERVVLPEPRTAATRHVPRERVAALIAELGQRAPASP
jgi:hypothetical protein